MSRVALVVGINTYSNLGPLKAPAKDAEAIAQCLTKDGDFRVIRLPEIIQDNQPKVGTQTHVTRTKLKKALVQLFKPDSSQAPDTALFYFSGHGIRDTLGFPEGYLATSEANPNNDSFGLSLRWLRRLLEESPVKQQIIWLDCCHSGEFLNFGEADPGDRGKGRDRCFIAASRDFEVAYEDLGSPHSVLTRSLLTGLDPNNHPNRWIDNFVLADFINQALRTEIQSPICNNSGEPINLTRSWQASNEQAMDRQLDLLCPYKGLTFFDCNDEDPKYFYGRTALTDQLLDTIRQSNFLAIVGASGSGKSSVLRAGLLHQLKLGRRLSGSDSWDIHLMVPGEHPLGKLALALIDETDTPLSRAEALQKVESLLKRGSDGLRYIVQASQAQRVVIVVDQFEECFTLCQNIEERQYFFQCLLNTLELCKEKLCIILAMRADFFGKCVEQDYSSLAKYIEGNLIAVKAMSRDELTDAITKPAEKTGLEVEPELVQEMLTDITGAPASLPLMQYALRELWYQREGNQIQLKTYSRLGGVMGTLKKRATTIYHSFDKTQQEATRHIFLSLTQLGEGTEDTRRRVLKQDLSTPVYPEDLIDRTVQALANANLLVTSEITAKSKNTKRFAVVDVAHEALIRHWPLLRTWLDANRELIRRQRKIEVMADEWADQQQKNEYLLRGVQLSDAQDFRTTHSQKLPLSKRALIFIRKSLKRRRNIRLRYSSLFLIPLIAIEILVRDNLLSLQYERVRDRKIDNNKNAIVELTKGCEQHKQIPNRFGYVDRSLLTYFLNRFYGNCRPIREGYLGKSDLSSIKINHGRFERSNFSFSNLRNSQITKSKISNSNFIFSDLSYSSFMRSKVQNTYFKNAILIGTNFELSDLSGTDFQESNVKGANFRKAYLDQTDLRNTNLEEADLTGALYTSTTQFPKDFNPGKSNLYLISSEAVIINADLKEIQLEARYIPSQTQQQIIYQRLQGSDLSKSRISKTNFSAAELAHINFSHSKLDKVIFQRASLQHLNFNGSSIRESSFNKAIFKTTQFEETIIKYSNFINSILSGSNFEKSTLENINFQDSNLNSASFRNSTLENINFTNADLNRADFRDTYFKDVVIDKANFKKSLYSSKTTFPKDFSPVKMGLFFIGENADLEKAKLSWKDLSSENLQGSNLRNATLKGTKLINANLENANLENANLENANLRYTSFQESNLKNTNFEGALYNSHTIFPANFFPAEHNMTLLKPRIDLSGKSIRGIDISFENLSSSTWTNADLRYALANNVILSNSDLRVVSFDGADLEFSDLSYSQLNFASFIGANLTDANLSKTDLENINLSGADLTRTNLTGAQNLTEQLLENAKICQTQIPNYINLDPNRNCADLSLEATHQD